MNRKNQKIIYYLFSKSGFVNIEESQNVKLIDLEKIKKFI